MLLLYIIYVYMYIFLSFFLSFFFFLFYLFIDLLIYIQSLTHWLHACLLKFRFYAGNFFVQIELWSRMPRWRCGSFWCRWPATCRRSSRPSFGSRQLGSNRFSLAGAWSEQVPCDMAKPSDRTCWEAWRCIFVPEIRWHCNTRAPMPIILYCFVSAHAI